MADDPQAGANAKPATTRVKRGFGLERVLGVAGALVAIGFFLPWMDLPGEGGRVSGLDVARSGGVWSGILAIPIFGSITAVMGGLRWKLSRYTGSATAIAMLVPAAYLLVTYCPWLYTVPLAAGVAVLVLGTLRRAPWLALPLGALLLVASVVGPLLAWDQLLVYATDDLGVMAAIPLVGLALLIPYCSVRLLWSGIRKKRRERALVIAGSSIIALDVYAAALVAFGPTLATAEIGLWMSALGGAALLLVSRPLASRRARAKAATPPREANAKSTNASPAKAEPSKPAPPKTDATGDDAAKLAKLEKLKQLKKLQLLEARRRAEAKAAQQEASTTKAGEVLASEPEPAFAADPTAPAAPENEDREALMQRMGVKPPPPPSENELENMLAALKKRAADDD